MLWRGVGDEGPALVLHGCRVLRLRTGRGGAGMPRAAGAVLVVMGAVAVGTTSCAGAARHDQQAHVRLAGRTRLPASATSVLTGGGGVVAEGAGQRLLASAPVGVVAKPNRPAEPAAAASQNPRAHPARPL